MMISKVTKINISATGQISEYPAPYRTGKYFLVDTAALAQKLTGFWAQDRWDMQSNPTGIYPQHRDCYRNIEFTCLNTLLTTELKYASFIKFHTGKWSPRTGNIAAQIHRINRFINATMPAVQSFLDYSLDEWELRLRTFLIEKNEWFPRTVLRVDARQNQRQVNRGDRCVEIFRVIYRELEEIYDVRPPFERDVWDLSQLGVPLNLARSGLKLNFSSIKRDRLREAAKKYVRKYMINRSVTSAQAIVTAVARFSRFLEKTHQVTDLPPVNRQLLLDFIFDLVATANLAPNTVYSQIAIFRGFLETSAREKWLPIPDHRLIYEDDLPRRTKNYPRFIPEFVMNRLESLIAQMPLPLRNLVLVLKETGMRISELCTLKLDCLAQDNDGDYFLRFYQMKMRKDHSVPISSATAAIIKLQRAIVLDSKAVTEYLFPRPKGRPYQAKHFNRRLNEFAFAHKIADETGKLWHFQAHQFRHTAGTRMINAGVQQHFVQKFLGHESPEMTARYAHIHDRTMKNVFDEYLSKRGSLIDISGEIISASGDSNQKKRKLSSAENTNKRDQNELLWLKKNMQAQTLANGYCSLPAAQSSCPHANACLTCINFRTDASFLPQHQHQLAETKRLIQISNANGWQRQTEMNERVKENLEKIISKIDDLNSSESAEMDVAKTD